MVLVLVKSNTPEDCSLSFHSKCLSTNSQSLNNFICLKVILKVFKYEALGNCAVLLLKIGFVLS